MNILGAVLKLAAVSVLLCTASRDPAQKWQLAAACFKHCQLALGMLSTCPPITPELLARPPPGLQVLLSLMSGRQLEKSLLQHVLAPGQEELAVSVAWFLSTLSFHKAWFKLPFTRSSTSLLAPWAQFEPAKTCCPYSAATQSAGIHGGRP
jgi:hypothetical protein